MSLMFNSKRQIPSFLPVSVFLISWSVVWKGGCLVKERRAVYSKGGLRIRAVKVKGKRDSRTTLSYWNFRII